MTGIPFDPWAIGVGEMVIEKSPFMPSSLQKKLREKRKDISGDIERGVKSTLAHAESFTRKTGDFIVPPPMEIPIPPPVLTPPSTYGLGLDRTGRSLPEIATETRRRRRRRLRLRAREEAYALEAGMLRGTAGLSKNAPGLSTGTFQGLRIP